MTRIAHVWPQAPRREDDELALEARVEWPTQWPRFWKDRRQVVGIRVPGDLAISDEAVGDAFLLGTVFGAMRRTRVLHVHGTVTEGRVENLERLVSLWVERRPDKYRRVEIRCDAVVPAAASSGSALLCYSGGLDSTYSLLRHTGPDRAASAAPVGAALMVRGADIPDEETAAYGRAFAKARRITASRGVELLTASTTLRRLKQNWTHSSNAALAAVLSLFRSRYGSALLAAGFTAQQAPAWWPQDLTDPPLVSTRAFPVVGDGYESDRFQKLLAIRDWPEAMEDLRVCYAPGVWDRNCGLCFKCLVVMGLARVAFGRMPPFLPRELTDADVRRMARAHDTVVLLRFEMIVRYARERGVRASWVAVMEDEIRKAGFDTARAST